MKKEVENLNFGDIEFLMKVKVIRKSARLNLDISVNVDKKKNKVEGFDVLINRNTTVEKKHHAELLLITNEKEDNFHYCLINDMSRLLPNKISNNKEKLYFCKRCLMSFRSEEKLKNHKALCDESQEGNVKMPDFIINKDDTIETPVLTFKNYNRAMKTPMMMVCDSESMLIDISEKSGKGTKRYQKHQMISYSILVQYINNIGENKLNLHCYRAKDDEDVSEICRTC